MGKQRNNSESKRRREISDKRISELIPEYYSGKYRTTTEFLCKFGLVKSTLYSYLHRHGLSPITKNARTHNFNENYFNVIDDSSKAYWLGFLQCDGYVVHKGNRHSIEVALTASDKAHLDKLQKALNSDYPIQKRIIAGKYEAVRITLNSFNLVIPLAELGIEKFRSCTMELLLDENHPFIFDYFRGIIDANGTIDMSGCSPAIWLSSGSRKFVDQFINILQKLFPNLYCCIHEKKIYCFFCLYWYSND